MKKYKVVITRDALADLKNYFIFKKEIDKTPHRK